jgi:predicted permease
MISDNMNLAFQAILLQILVFLAGIYLVQRRIVAKDNMDTYTNLLEYLFVPCLTITVFLKTDEFNVFPNWQQWFPKLLLVLGVPVLNYVISVFTFQKILTSNEDQKYGAIFTFTTAFADSAPILFLLVSNFNVFISKYLEVQPSEKGVLELASLYDVFLIMITTRTVRWIVLKKCTHRDEDGIPFLKLPGLEETMLVEKCCDEYDLDSSYSFGYVLKKSPFVVALGITWLICLIQPLKLVFIQSGSFLQDGILHPFELVGKMAPLLLIIGLGAAFFLCDFQNFTFDKSIVIITIIRFVVCLAMGYLFNCLPFIDSQFGLILNFTFITPTSIWTTKQIIRNESDIERILIPQYFVYFAVAVPVYSFFLCN